MSTDTELEIVGAGDLASLAFELNVRAPRRDDEADRERFEMELAWEQNRDQWGRPKVKKPDGKYWGYRRASSFGSPMENTRLLDNWKLRKLSEAIAKNAAMRLAVTRVVRQLEAAEEAGDEERIRKAKKDHDELCEAALKWVGAEDKASIGTSLHDILELDDLGKALGHVDEEFKPDVAAYRRMRQCFTTLSSERIVVNHEFQIGGKYDRIVQLLYPMRTHTGFELPAGAVIVGDVKTAQKMDFAGCKFGQQIWTYANSELYDPREGAHRTYAWPHEPPRTDWAVIMHVPSGQGIARLYWVDLKFYKPAMKDTINTYNWRNRGKKGIGPAQSYEDYVLTAKLAKSVDELMAAYARAVAMGEWNDEIAPVFTARKLELQATDPEPPVQGPDAGPLADDPEAFYENQEQSA